MTKKKIGILFGMEDTFPWALINEINLRAGDQVEAGQLEVSAIKDNGLYGYDVILDRISHEVPFYRTMLKCAVAAGATVLNNPFWWSADDKFFDNLAARAAGVEVPRTMLLPHKEYPPNTEAKSFRNMRHVDWQDVFDYLKFPIFMKPAYGGGWKDVYKCVDPQSFFEAYDQTRDLAMMAQEAIEFDDYYRIYVLGRDRVRIMRYDPTVPHQERYVLGAEEPDPALLERMRRDAITLCEALGYDMNTVEFAIRDGVPIAIDFMNCACDADYYSVGEENFTWFVNNMAEVLIDRALNPRPFEATGSWPRQVGIAPLMESKATAAPEVPAVPAAASPEKAKKTSNRIVAAAKPKAVPKPKSTTKA